MSAFKHAGQPDRASDLQFADESESDRWHAGRRTAIDTILAAIAQSPYAQSLVLRGSILLRAWFGDEARDPGDLDFIVVPDDWELDEPRTTEMLEGIARAAELLSADADRDVRILALDAVSDHIWTYDQAPGRRLVLPWTAPGDLPGGSIQLDFVFGEYLPLDPVPTVVPRALRADGAPDTVLLAATQELSLAWKVMWLTTDDYPQGKDLFDAVLLAEHTKLRRSVLSTLFENGKDPDAYLANPVGLQQIAEIDVDWDVFVEQYPDKAWVQQDSVRRLMVALAPTFVPGSELGITMYAASADWLAPQIETYRELLDDADLPAVYAEMARDRIDPHTALVITRELLGSDRPTADEVFLLLNQNPVWALRFQDRASDGMVTQWLAELGVSEGLCARTDVPRTRLIRRIHKDFPDEAVAQRVIHMLADLPIGAHRNLPKSGNDPLFVTERFLAALLIASAGDFEKLSTSAYSVRQDPPAVLVAAGLDGEDWPARLDGELAQ